ncbi:cysteine protease ATG4B-like [Pomacea canaliculata]|uniref:cysteine protease ATG4B-like n=1 Tax=Pomacea canaliculata TaxID=400727 RepID=UPI000D734884|nr:cysteine protease ATG4B-like [Pomacea canaliculata]
MDFDDSFLPCAANISTLTYESGPRPHDEFPRTAEPVYILGKMFSTLHDMEELKEDIRSRLWFTYRKNFPSIGSSGQVSDTGWGCMLRCGQMMLAQALLLRHLGRDWQWHPGCQEQNYWRILSMFQDRKACIYSIHQIASMGESEGKAVGQWFGPNTIAQVLKRMAIYDDWSRLAIHVALDNTVIEDDISNSCRGRESSLPCTWQPLLLIVPLRLGLTDINPIYFEALKHCLSLQQSVGIIGGKPNHAHWFIGFVGDEIVYLDPHTTQLAGNIDDLEEQAALDESYHCPFPGRMKMTRLDPSVAVGFYCESEKNFDDLCQSFRKFSKSNKNCMFEIRKERPLHLQYTLRAVAASSKHSGFQMLGAEAEGSSVDEEEFEII